MNNVKIDQEFIARVIEISRIAGDAILEIYHATEATNINIKDDGSPVTAADFAAHRVIAKALHELLPIPIISEEADLPAASQRQAWSHYWLVDPLDGTKEFIARTGEFTVNIALMQNNIPVLGVVHTPVTDESYMGVDQSVYVDGKSHAEKYAAGKKVKELQTRDTKVRCEAKQALDVLVSHRHSNSETIALLERLQQHWPVALNYIKVGSSLKFCWIAEGRADFYPRLGPTSEWDTAAAQAVLVAAGGMIVNAQNLTALTYNASETLLNPWFFAIADVELKTLLLRVL